MKETWKRSLDSVISTSPLFLAKDWLQHTRKKRPKNRRKCNFVLIHLSRWSAIDVDLFLLCAVLPIVRGRALSGVLPSPWQNKYGSTPE